MLSIHLLRLKTIVIYLLLFVSCKLIFINQALANMDKEPPTCALSFSSLPLYSEKVMLNFSLDNSLNKKLTILTWYTPFEGFLSNLFIIINTDTGEQLQYRGPMVKRLEPEVEDYVILEEKSTISTTLNLSKAYQFSQGNYQLTLKQNTFYLREQYFTASSFACDAPSITFRVK